MRENPPKAKKYIRQRRQRRELRGLITALASVIVFCTTYALILPAITMERGPCDIPEHTHGVACYTQITSQTETVLGCSPETVGVHTHGPECLDEEGRLICRRADFIAHEHNELCANGHCAFEEIKPHTHEEGCYAPAAVHIHNESCVTLERGELLCALSETREHVHGESCFVTESHLVCGQEETGGHGHGEACLDEQGQLICGLEEIPAHTHAEACWQAQQTQVCTIEYDILHEHTDSCYALQEKMICPLEEGASDPVLLCTEPEVILHTHAEFCCDEFGELVCDETEILQHSHSEGCLIVVEIPVDTAELTCSLSEAEGHLHNELCYGLWELTCTQTEHTHNELCTPVEATPEPTPEPTPAPANPALAADEAYVAELTSAGGRVLTDDGEERMPMTVKPGERVEFPFTLTTGSYTGRTFGQGRIKLEFILPAGEEQAAFDLTALSWADTAEGYAPSLAWETRLMGEEPANCQVLTAWWPLGDETGENQVVPGRVEGTVAVEVRDMAPGENLGLIIRAAMEHNAWDGICETHQTVETLSVATTGFTVVPLRSAEEIQARRDALEAEIAALESTGCRSEEERQSAEVLQERLRAAYQQGELTDEDYLALTQRLEQLFHNEQITIAEPADGTNWMLLRDSGWFEAYSHCDYAAAYAPSGAAYRMSAPLQAVAEEAEQPSDIQVNDRGGSRNSADGAVTVSKTIAGTELENVFDITLQVETSVNVQEITREPDMAVVIVMDISNTMNEDFGTTSRYKAAMTAAESFLDQFAANNAMGISKIGYVAFNTDAHQIFGLQPCSNQTQADALKNIMRTATGDIINNYEKDADGYTIDPDRFTNVEAGLAMGADMLSGVDNDNKFIIFLSDGFPTTYIKTGYEGHETYDSTGAAFYDHVLNRYCHYGNSYSDTAAIRAREKAAAIKAAGVTIYSIGVDVGGQTIQQYIAQSEKATNHSVVDRSGESYEIGDAASAEAYKNWLRNSIGSGYYYDSTDAEGLNNAYSLIFQSIQEKVEAGTVADWVTADPLPTVSGVAETVEFIGFYTKTPELAGDTLTGSNVVGGKNTAQFHGDNAFIYWDLKNSGYQSTSVGTTTNYIYQLVYRVRLQNEAPVFVEENIYPTNDPTTLQYRSIEGTAGNLSVSNPKTLDYPIPSVHGYLAELKFQKADAYSAPLPGAEFTLAHDRENCWECRGDGTAVAIDDQVAVSAADGSVTFTNIPSGHLYTLTETRIPAGFSATGDKYAAEVAYDKTTVTVTAYDGAEKEWTGTIVNQTYYELPETGGRGTMPYTIGGLGLMTLAGWLLFHRFRKRRMDSA